MHTHQNFERTDMWREGKWLDLWSVVHFLSGTSIGLGFYFLHFDALAAVLLALVALVAYEMWEMLVKIEETPTNRFMDVVVGMASFLPTYFVFAPPLQHVLLVSFSVVCTFNIALGALGWRESKKAATLQERMRERYIAERALLRKRQQKLRKRFESAKKRKRESGSATPGDGANP